MEGDLLRNPQIKSYLSHFKDKDFNRVIKLTLTWGILTLDLQKHLNQITPESLEVLIETLEEEIHRNQQKQVQERPAGKPTFADARDNASLGGDHPFAAEAATQPPLAGQYYPQQHVAQVQQYTDVSNYPSLPPQPHPHPVAQLSQVPLNTNSTLPPPHPTTTVYPSNFPQTTYAESHKAPMRPLTTNANLLNKKRPSSATSTSTIEYQVHPNWWGHEQFIASKPKVKKQAVKPKQPVEEAKTAPKTSGPAKKIVPTEKKATGSATRFRIVRSPTKMDYQTPKRLVDEITQTWGISSPNEANGPVKKTQPAKKQASRPGSVPRKPPQEKKGFWTIPFKDPDSSSATSGHGPGDTDDALESSSSVHQAKFESEDEGEASQSSANDLSQTENEMHSSQTENESRSSRNLTSSVSSHQNRDGFISSSSQHSSSKASYQSDGTVSASQSSLKVPVSTYRGRRANKPQQKHAPQAIHITRVGAVPSTNDDNTDENREPQNHQSQRLTKTASPKGKTNTTRKDNSHEASERPKYTGTGITQLANSFLNSSFIECLDKEVERPPFKLIDGPYIGENRGSTDHDEDSSSRIDTNSSLSSLQQSTERDNESENVNPEEEQEDREHLDYMAKKRAMGLLTVSEDLLYDMDAMLKTDK